jgi:hypothetical protein
VISPQGSRIGSGGKRVNRFPRGDGDEVDPLGERGEKDGELLANGRVQQGAVLRTTPIGTCATPGPPRPGPDRFS